MESRNLVPFREDPSLERSRPPTPVNYVPAAPEEPFWSNYWLILRKRKWAIVASVAIVTTVAAIITLRTTRIYQAVARIAINRTNTDVLLGFKDVGTSISPDADAMDINTQASILQSNSISLQVIKRLGWDSELVGPGEAGVSRPREGPSDTTREAALIRTFRSNLVVAIVPDTRIIEIRYSNPDPQLAAKALNTLVDVFVEQNVKTKFDSTMQASDWLSKQLGELQMKVESSQEKILKYQKENGLFGVDEKENIITAKLDELNKELTAAEADRIQKQSKYELTLSGNPELVGAADSNSLVEKLTSKEAELKLQYAKASTEFGPNHPAVQELSNQLKQIEISTQAARGKMSARAENEYKAALQHEKLLRASFEAQKEEANRLNEKTVEYSLLKRDFEANRQLYQELLQKLKEAGISSALKSSNIGVVDSALVPTVPASPNIPRNLELSLLLGLLGGVGLAFILEGLDSTLKTPEQVEVISALPSLGMIPLNPNGAHRRGQRRHALAAPNGHEPSADLIAYHRPQSELAESFRALRTSVLLSTMDTPPRVIVVTSALPREGKTTLCLNFAVVMAQKGAKTLLIDADLRLPGIHHALGVRRSPGLSTVLMGSDSLENAIIPCAQPNLFVLPSGPKPPHPAELLDSPQMKKLLAECRTKFDHIIIDTPPALTVTDSVILSVEADAVVLVVWSGATTRNAIRRVRDLLLQVNAKILGIALNAVNLQSPDLYYYYYTSKHGGRYYTDGAPRT